MLFQRICAGCPELADVSLNGVKKCDALVAELCKCVSLQHLDLNNSDVSRKALSKLELANPDCDISTMHCFKLNANS